MWLDEVDRYLAAGCLSRVGERTYEPFHHLVSHVLQEPDAAEVPEVVWSLIPHRIPLAYLSTFGFAAYETERFTVAEHAWARFLERFPKHPEANLGKALLTLRSGDRSGALPFLRQAVADEDPRAMARLGAVLARIALDGEDPSAADEAGDWLRRAHDAGERTEAHLAGLLAYRACDESGALFWFDVAAEQGDGNAMFLHACLETWGVDERRLLRLLDEFLGEEDRPEKLHELLAGLPHNRAERSGDRLSFRKSRWGSKAAAGNVHAMYLMGRSLEARRRWKGALILHQRAAQKGSLASARRVPPVYRALNQHQRASAWREAVSRTAATGAAVSGVGALAEQIFHEYENSGSKGGAETITVADAEEWTAGRAGWGGGTPSYPGHRSSRGSSVSGDSSHSSPYASDSSPFHESPYSGGSSSRDSSSSSGGSSSYGGDDY
ncbi:hypothetical protein [Nocardiopsis synnemataformans]|uniref:tetratricopeptide repeat protein n=1 Tax=Nocardiopsis synnemataformans TaxID=61305 RepID=UPI003EBDF3EC